MQHPYYGYLIVHTMRWLWSHELYTSHHLWRQFNLDFYNISQAFCGIPFISSITRSVEEHWHLWLKFPSNLLNLISSLIKTNVQAYHKSFQSSMVVIFLLKDSEYFQLYAAINYILTCDTQPLSGAFFIQLTKAN